MAATWEHREGDELTLRAYRRAGGVAYALNRSAQAAYYALTDRQQDVARLVFTQLTVLTVGGRFERRRCRRTDLCAPGAQIAADVDAVIEIFSAHRLFTLGQNSVEISHDVLFQAWKQLRDWLGDDQLDRALYSQIATDAFIWDGNGRDPSYLYRPGRLATIDAASSRWRAAPSRYAPLSATSTEFLDAARRAARRSIRGRRAVIAGLLALTVIAISTAGAGVHDAANASREHAIALSRQLAVESLAIDTSDPMTARRLAVAAWSVSHTREASSVMTALLTEQQQGGILAADPSAYPVSGVAFSPDGTRLASADSDGTVRLWNPATGREAGAPIHADSGPGGAVFGVAFSPDGTLLASADADGTIRLWNPVTGHEVGAPLQAVARPGRTVSGVAFNPEGRLRPSITGQAAGAPVQAAAARGARCSAWRSARTASCWPAPTPTARSGCGTPPPATRSAPRCRRIAAPAMACSRWRSARTARCWPAPTPTARSGCGTPPPATRSATPLQAARSQHRLMACSRWRSARTATCWPSPPAKASCSCGIRPPGWRPALPSKPIPARCRA